MWAWIETMRFRKFREMFFTGLPFTTGEMDKRNLLTSVVLRARLEDEVQKYALAFTRNGLMDRIVIQKAFLELYNQHRGECQCGMLNSIFEAVAVSGAVKAQYGEVELSPELMKRGFNNPVKEFESNFPKELHIGQWGQRKT